MADERIIELDTINEVPADGYLAIDTVTGDTYKILPIKIGAQYTIQDGDHSFTLVGSNGYSHTVNIPYDSETINLADFNQLTPEEQDNGTAYYVPDKDVPVADELWAKVGRTQLDGSTQDLSKAHNNLMARVDDLEDTVGDTALPSGMSSVTDGISQLNSRFVTKTYSATTGTTQYADFYYADITIDSNYGNEASVLIWSVTSNRPAFVVRISAFKYRVFTNVATTTVTIKVRFDKLYV